MRILAGDIGGTKTAIGIAEVGASACAFDRVARYPSADYPGLAEIVQEFLRTERRFPEAAGFGVAGPVRRGSAKVTKLPWRIEEDALADAIGIPRVRLVNDFFAAGIGISYLKPRQLVTLERGRAEAGAARAILGAGTGLGQAGLVPNGPRWDVVASEGGHVDLGPRDEREDRLVQFVRSRFGRCTRDRILSGGGLGLVYEFLREDGAAPESPTVRAGLDEAGDHAAVISRYGLSGRDRLCRESLSLFVSIYGSETGNIALQYRATGGVYVAGGIAPKILPAIRRPEFLRAFHAKPPMEELLAAIPVRVVKDPALGLIGAAAAAYWTRIETTRSSRKTSTRPARR
jgi:glucokinase